MLRPVRGQHRSTGPPARPLRSDPTRRCSARRRSRWPSTRAPARSTPTDPDHPDQRGRRGRPGRSSLDSGAAGGVGARWRPAAGPPRRGRRTRDAGFGRGAARDIVGSGVDDRTAAVGAHPGRPATAAGGAADGGRAPRRRGSLRRRGRRPGGRVRAGIGGAAADHLGVEPRVVARRRLGGGDPPRLAGRPRAERTDGDRAANVERERHCGQCPADPSADRLRTGVLRHGRGTPGRRARRLLEVAAGGAPRPGSVLGRVRLAPAAAEMGGIRSPVGRWSNRDAGIGRGATDLGHLDGSRSGSSRCGRRHGGRAQLGGLLPPGGLRWDRRCAGRTGSDRAARGALGRLGPAHAAPAAAPAGGAGPAGSAAPAVAGAPAMQLEELARQLFDPLSARLKSELWIDRERAGMVADLRR